MSNGDVVKWLADASSPAQTAGGRPNQVEDQLRMNPWDLTTKGQASMDDDQGQGHSRT